MCLLAETEGDNIPLPNVNSKVLVKIIDYCKEHAKTGSEDEKDKDKAPTKSEEDMKSWDAEFMKVDQGELFEIILVSLSITPRMHGTIMQALHM